MREPPAASVSPTRPIGQPATIEVREVLPRDAIPSIDDPRFDPDYFGEPGDRVIVVEADQPRAYPIRVLSYHEIVNDVLGSGAPASGRDSRDDSGDAVDGGPIAITWCPICGSAIVFDRTVGDRTLTFGTSGKLADDALVMYDRETGSEWKQPTGEAIAGPLEGEVLRMVPSTVSTWERFRADHPEGVVLQPARADARRRDPAEVYDMERYRAYFDGAAFGLYGMRGEGEPRTWDREDVDPKTVVLGIEHRGEAKGFPLPLVEAARGVVTDDVGGLDVVVFASDGELYAYEDPGFGFSPADGGFAGDGAVWDPHSGKGDDGRRLDRVPARRFFAFAWQDAHGEGAFVRPG